MQKQVMQSAERKRNPFRLSGWGGMTMVSLGLLILWYTFVGTTIENWWAVFIILPALFFMMLAGGLFYWQNGRFNIFVSINAGIGLVILTVAMMFFLNLDWGIWWPMMIIMPGAAVALNRLGLRDGSSAVTAVASMCAWIGGTIVLLGLAFLADRFGMIDLSPSFNEFQWWGYFILLPAFGAVVNMLRLFYQNGKRVTVGVVILAATSLLFGWTAVVELLDLSWSTLPNMFSAIFIMSGIAVLVNGLRQ